MAEQKTLPTQVDVLEYLESISDPVRRADGLLLNQMMANITDKPAVMWGPTMIGYDQYYYKSQSGQEGIWFRVGFAPRASAISLYGLISFPEADTLLARLGKHKLGKGCLYIKKLADVDVEVLTQLIKRGYEDNLHNFPLRVRPTPVKTK